ncbi:MAG: elongation factor 4 [Kiritimatiellae bacterium]|nr:elongation factor 4 [Kiritimatiellia bacterium]
MPDLSHIRNFCIIAHIDHGKSTLADRMLELTKTVQQRDLREQLLDDMDLERERGITIKAHPVTMDYKAQDGKTYQFNLIDTPGHVDFSYEVSRSLSACEGVLLVVDAAQGVEAQTVANTYLAVDQGLEVIPVLNKIDLPNADVKGVSKQIEDILAIPMGDCLKISAKTGEGVPAVMEAVVQKIPPPTEGDSTCTRALIFDSMYNVYQGAVSYIRVVDGKIKKGETVRLMSMKQDYEVKEVGIFTPKPTPVSELQMGEVGYLAANIKDASEIKIGDTIAKRDRLPKDPLPGFKEIQPMVFSGIYPVNTADFERLKISMEKLSLNDSSFQYQAESSVALGLGFRCGFLGLLHMEIVQERLRREYDVDIITTYPGVIYQVFLTNGERLEIDNPIHLPEPSRIAHMEEPMVQAFIICHNQNIGDLLQLIRDRRGELEKTDSLDSQRVMLTCKLPLNEILIDFHDKLKSISRGYASMDYDHVGYEQADLVKLDILVHHETVDAFSSVVHRSKALFRGRQMCKSLKEVIPSQLFAVPIQAAIQSNVIARETIRAMRKDVTAKCYGGDITRKRKLLERQKEGKKRMKQIGKVSIPQEAFISVLKSS